MLLRHHNYPTCDSGEKFYASERTNLRDLEVIFPSRCLYGLVVPLLQECLPKYESHIKLKRIHIKCNTYLYKEPKIFLISFSLRSNRSRNVSIQEWKNSYVPRNRSVINSFDFFSFFSLPFFLILAIVLLKVFQVPSIVPQS